MSIIPIQIFNQNIPQEIDYDNLCPICYDQIEQNTSYTLEECNHKFHTYCIIKWLRSEHSNCPMCNGISSQNQRMYYRTDRDNKIKLILNYSKRKTACKKVINLVNRYRKKNKEFINVKKEYLIFKKNHKDIFKKKTQFTSKIWKLRKSTEKLKRDLYNIPIQPIIIK